MKFKDNVRLADLQAQTVLAMVICDDVYAKHGKELWITSVDDSVHGKNSLHPKGLAFDTRTRDLDEATKRLILTDLKKALEVNYDVIDEGDHFHIEYDPK